MSLSILGAGHVGMALATALTRRGETVTLGVPEPAVCAPNIVTNGWTVITGGR